VGIALIAASPVPLKRQKPLVRKRRMAAIQLPLSPGAKLIRFPAVRYALKMCSGRIERLVTASADRMSQARSRVVHKSATVSRSKYMIVCALNRWQGSFHAVFG
jgi:hypothetical protein